MDAVTLLPVPDEGWTVHDLDGLPDDGLRYELVDGVLLVSAAPVARHQLALSALLVLLAAAAPAHLRVLPAPLDVQFTPRRQLQPDLNVVPADALGGAKILVPPLLCVEVLSPSTRATDLTLKRLVLQEAGVPSYWLVDPHVPSLVVLELRDGAYVEVASVQGDEAWDATTPYPVRVVPADLVR